MCTHYTNIPPNYHWSGTISSWSTFALKSWILIVYYAVIRLGTCIVHMLLIHYNSLVPLLFNNLMYKMNLSDIFPYFQSWARAQHPWISWNWQKNVLYFHAFCDYQIYWNATATLFYFFQSRESVLQNQIQRKCWVNFFLELYAENIWYFRRNIPVAHQR